jgi:hypothetical protein
MRTLQFKVKCGVKLCGKCKQLGRIGCMMIRDEYGYPTRLNVNSQGSDLRCPECLAAEVKK